MAGPNGGWGAARRETIASRVFAGVVWAGLIVMLGANLLATLTARGVTVVAGASGEPLGIASATWTTLTLPAQGVPHPGRRASSLQTRSLSAFPAVRVYLPSGFASAIFHRNWKPSRAKPS